MTARTWLKITLFSGTSIAILAVMGLCVAIYPGDAFMDYTVVNDTQTPLLTWVMDRQCEDVIGRQGDYSPVKEVPANGRFEYSSHSTADGCIQVAAEDRRLVLSQPYESGAEVRVAEPLTYLSAPLPTEDELEARPWWETFTKPSRRLLTFYILFSAIAVGGIIALWAARKLQRQGGIA